MEEENTKVFISHAGEDNERFVFGFAEKLYAKGIEAWVDRWEMLPGDSIIEKIFEEGIAQAQAMVVVVSEYSINKPWVREELNAGMVRKIDGVSKLIPVVIGSVEDSGVPESLKTSVWEKIEDLDNYEAEFSRIVDAIYGRREKPLLGERPEYLSDELKTVRDLSAADSLILKLSCEAEIERGQKGATVDPESVIEKAQSAGVHQEQALESMTILNDRGYMETSHRLGSTVPGHLTLTDYGFDEYGHTYIPEYDSLIRSVGLQILNHDMHDSADIAKALDQPLAIIERIFSLFDLNGYVTIFPETSFSLQIARVSPELRRWLEDL